MQIETPKVELISVRDIEIAPLIKSQPRWEEADPKFRSFCADIRERGIQEPLRVDENNVLWDGFDRLRAAKRARFQEVPILRCKSEDGPDIAFSSYLQRKHGSKSQRVYSAYPYFLSRHELAKNRATITRERGGKVTESAAMESVDSMATELGISRDLFYQAAKLHEIFAADPDLREEFEPQIMKDEDPISLGGALAGIAGKSATQGKSRNASKGGKIGLFKEAFKLLTTRYKHWDRFEDNDKELAVIAVRKSVSAMPTDLRSEIKRAIKQAEKEENDEALAHGA